MFYAPIRVDSTKISDLFGRTKMWLANETMRKYQASNDDTKRMHSAIMNMYRSPSCGLPLTFWGDAVQDAAYVTERSLANVNSAKISTLQLKTKKYPLFVRLYF